VFILVFILVFIFVFVSFCSSPSMSVALSTQGDNGKKNEAAAWKEVDAKLNATWVDLKKVCQSTEKIWSDVKDGEGHSGILEKRIRELENTMSGADKALEDIGYLLKYRKCRSSGEPLTIETAKAYQVKAARSLMECRDAAIQVKALRPRKRDEDDDDKDKDKKKAKKSKKR